MSHRLYAKRGTDLPWSKLTEAKVADIRREHAYKERQKRDLDAKHSAAAIARREGVHKNTIDKILSFATWVHVR